MSLRCCNKQCFFQNIAYSMVFNNFLNGIRGLWECRIETIILSLLFISLGILFFVGLRKNSGKLFMLFLIAEPVLLSLDITKNSLDLKNLTKYDPDFKTKRLFLILNLIGGAINWIMLGIVFLYYRQMKLNKQRRRCNQSINGDDPQEQKKDDVEQLEIKI